jgi:hypothetical protein
MVNFAIPIIYAVSASQVKIEGHGKLYVILFFYRLWWVRFSRAARLPKLLKKLLYPAGSLKNSLKFMLSLL